MAIINKGVHTSQWFRNANILLNADRTEFAGRVTNAEKAKALWDRFNNPKQGSWLNMTAYFNQNQFNNEQGVRSTILSQQTHAL